MCTVEVFNKKQLSTECMILLIPMLGTKVMRYIYMHFLRVVIF